MIPAPVRSVHRRICRGSLAAFSVAAAVGVLTGCQGQRPSIDVPVSNWPGYEYMYLAHKLGLDRREGLELKPLQFPDPQTIVHAYLRGDLPLAQLTTVEAVDLCSRDPSRCPVIASVWVASSSSCCRLRCCERRCSVLIVNSALPLSSQMVSPRCNT